MDYTYIPIRGLTRPTPQHLCITWDRPPFPRIMLRPDLSIVHTVQTLLDVLQEIGYVQLGYNHQNNDEGTEAQTLISWKIAPYSTVESDERPEPAYLPGPQSDPGADSLTQFLDLVAAEVRRAQAKYPILHSLHEAESVLREEVTELTREIFVQQADRDWLALRTEAVHVGAMVARLFVERLGSEDLARETALYRDSLEQQVADLRTENARLRTRLDARARTTSDAEASAVTAPMSVLIQTAADQYLTVGRQAVLAPLEAYLRQHGLTCPRCGAPWEFVYVADSATNPFLRCSNPACQAVPQLPG